MKITHRFGDTEFEFDLCRPTDLSIPMRFGGPQPNAYGVDPAVSKACEYGDLVGDTRRGGGCNFEQVTLIPHCNGTHTECVGHITDERISVRDCLREAFLPAVLISVSPEELAETSDSYPNLAEGGDPVITASAISEGLEEYLSGDSRIGALVVRTLPNSKDKLSTLYTNEIPPYFTTEAARLIDRLGIGHLLCDLPSIDRLHDGGRLSNHRIFWKLEDGSTALGPGSRKDRTVTELVYAPNSAKDGLYLLNLQIAPFHSDAAPSRPLLFPGRPIS
ncbi:MAG: cyclase family protein [Acidobacteriota bacterium]|nr:MAG: cyclase family protein [Acidobacteriota bacterium]